MGSIHAQRSSTVAVEGASRRVRAVLVCLAIGVAIPAPFGAAAAGAQGQGATLSLPLVGQSSEGRLERQASHAWAVELAANEYFEASLEAEGLALNDGDQWPRATVTAPSGAVVFEANQPHVTLSIDRGTRLVVAFVSAEAGLHRLRVSAGAQVAAHQPYRLRVHRREPAGPLSATRLEVHRLWAEGLAQYARSTRDSRMAALEKYTAALERLRGLDDDEAVALTHATLATVHYARADATAGGAAAASALAIWERLGRDVEVGAALSDLGLLAYLGYDHAKAREFYERALDRHRSMQDDAGEALTLVRLGWVDFAAGEMGRVIDVNHRALPLWQRLGNVGGESVSHNDLGRAYNELGEVGQALDAYRAALATRPEDIEPRAAAVTLGRLAQLYYTAGDWQQALASLERALPLARKAADGRNEASILSGLGLSLSRIGDSEGALRYLEPALVRARSSGNRNVEGNVLAGLGVEAYLRGDHQESRTYLLQALEVQRAIKDTVGAAGTLRYLATTQLAQGFAADALGSIEESLALSQASGANPSSLATLGAAHAALGDHQRAEDAFSRAVARARTIRARGQESSALVLFGTYLRDRGRLDDAARTLREALSLTESLRTGLTDLDQRMNYTGRSARVFELLVDVLMRLEEREKTGVHAREAFHAAEASRGRGLLDLLAASGVDVRQGVSPELVERERSLRWRLNARAAIQTTLLSGPPNAKRLASIERELADLSREWRDTTAAMRRQSAAFASLSEPTPLGVDEVAPLLGPDTVLLEFVPGAERSWLFALTASTFDAYPLPRRQQLDDVARSVHQLLAARQPVPRESPEARQARVARADRGLATRLQELSDLALGPIAHKLATDWKSARLAVVAGGALEYVPLAVLPVPNDPSGARLVMRHEVLTLSSASTLPFLRREGSAASADRRRLAVVADPVFSADDPRVAATGAANAPSREVTREGFSRLPFSRQEAEAVVAEAGGASVLRATDFDASLELATAGRLERYDILHLATHGVIDSRRPELSGLALTLVDRTGRPRDGFLRLNTIYNLRLSADLVVLSACQTAVGKELVGEGLVGLSRGFIQAGARRVVASLWQVNDAATAELMKRFYRGLFRQRLRPAAALSQAQREMADHPRWSAPYYWAGFVLQGDWQ